MQHSWYNSTLFYQQDKENATNSIFDIGSKRDTRFLFNGKKYTKLVKRNVRVGIL